MSSSTQIRAPSSFLSLAPTTSASYPQTPPPRTTPTLTTSALAQALAGTDSDKPRTSSLSSDGSNKSGAGLRFLKLGPVHYGEHLDGAKGDWHEVAVE